MARHARLSLPDLAFILAMGLALPARAANILVDIDVPDIAADGKCSLIEAIRNANADAALHPDCAAGSGADVISLPGGSTLTVSSPFFSTQALPSISSPMTIQGNGATINVAAVPVDTVFNVTLHGDLTLNDATISGDAGSGTATAAPRVLNHGKLQLHNVTLALNADIVSGIGSDGTVQADGLAVKSEGFFSGHRYYTGYGIVNRGAMTLENSQVNGLLLEDASRYGALVNKGSMTLVKVAVSGNYPNNTPFVGGIDNYGVINGSGVSVVSNPAFYYANAGVFNRSGATLTLKDSVITGNGSNTRWGSFGGLSNYGRAYLERVELNNSNDIRNGGYLKLVDGSVSGVGLYSGGAINNGFRRYRIDWC